jgi:hypothetical protein
LDYRLQAESQITQAFRLKAVLQTEIRPLPNRLQDLCRHLVEFSFVDRRPVRPAHRNRKPAKRERDSTISLVAGLAMVEFVASLWNRDR